MRIYNYFSSEPEKKISLLEFKLILYLMRISHVAYKYYCFLFYYNLLKLINKHLNYKLNIIIFIINLS